MCMRTEKDDFGCEFLIYKWMSVKVQSPVFSSEKNGNDWGTERGGLGNTMVIIWYFLLHNLQNRIPQLRIETGKMHFEEGRLW